MRRRVWKRVARHSEHERIAKPLQKSHQVREVPQLNNNRGNNRRRGRGNNRPQGGGQQLNRVDSRARGNAPQMLEKYRKLAQDAHLNGDRVQAEYYLQFADHYFRVIADTRVRQDEQRQRGPGERWQESEGEDEGLDFSMENDFPGYQQQPRREEPREQETQDREPREPREREGQREGREREPRNRDGQNREGRGRDNRDRDNREQRPRRFEPQQATEGNIPVEPVQELVRADEGEPIAADASENPFVRAPRPTRGLRPRGEGRQRREADDVPAGLDPSSLPPAIGFRAEPEPAAPVAPVAPAVPVADEDAAPAPRKRGRPRKNPLPEAAASGD
jgi:hypothetical protein